MSLSPGPQFARLIEYLTRRYATARTIHLVMDNLTTHGPKSLIDSFGEEQVTFYSFPKIAKTWIGSYRSALPSEQSDR